MTEEGIFTFTVFDLSDGARQPWRFKLRPGGLPVKVGRQPGCEILLDDARGVSNLHAEIRLAPGTSKPQLLITDRSTNGTAVRKPNATETISLQKEKEEVLVDGAMIQLPSKLKATEHKAVILRVQYDPSPGIEANRPGNIPRPSADAEANSLGVATRPKAAVPRPTTPNQKPPTELAGYPAVAAPQRSSQMPPHAQPNVTPQHSSRLQPTVEAAQLAREQRAAQHSKSRSPPRRRTLPQPPQRTSIQQAPASIRRQGAEEGAPTERRAQPQPQQQRPSVQQASATVRRQGAEKGGPAAKANGGVDADSVTESPSQLEALDKLLDMVDERANAQKDLAKSSQPSVASSADSALRRREEERSRELERMREEKRRRDRDDERRREEKRRQSEDEQKLEEERQLDDVRRWAAERRREDTRRARSRSPTPGGTEKAKPKILPKSRVPVHLEPRTRQQLQDTRSPDRRQQSVNSSRQRQRSPSLSRSPQRGTEGGPQGKPWVVRGKLGDKPGEGGGAWNDDWKSWNKNSSKDGSSKRYEGSDWGTWEKGKQWGQRWEKGNHDGGRRKE